MGSNLAGIIFANLYEKKLPELTAKRTLASVPFGGKYRLVDFPLSNMSNAGINNVALVTTNNFHSLMDHVGSGTAWNLSKRRTGLTMLSPYGSHSFNTRIEALYHLHGYIEHLKEEYLLLTACNTVSNIDYLKVFDFHQQMDADITLVYKNREESDRTYDDLAFEIEDDGHITQILLNPEKPGPRNFSTGSMIIKRDLLMALVKRCMSLNQLDFKKNILQDNVNNLSIYGYEFKDHIFSFGSIADYYIENMRLMQSDIRAELFNPQRPIYTKVRDDAPCRYGLTSSVSGSLVSQGCVINGEVENSILSKGVYIGKGAKVKNCIIMQDTKIADGAELEYVIVDKDVVIGENKKLSGTDTFPIYIQKQAVV
ncbi:MAG: glucose-1-phosphate adenylyltransferase subunit GlgD [Ruminococcus sp.]